MPKIKDKNRLTEVDRAIAQYKVQNPGATHGEIGEAVGRKREAVAKALDSPKLQKEIARLQSDVWESIKRIRLKAMAKAESLVSREPNSEVQERIQADMVKEFIKPILAHPAGFPTSAPELPEFVDTPDEVDE